MIAKKENKEKEKLSDIIEKNNEKGYRIEIVNGKVYEIRRRLIGDLKDFT